MTKRERGQLRLHRDRADRPPPPELDAIRREIDELDTQLLDLIERRLQLALTTVEVKRRHGLPVHDVRRDVQVVGRGVRLARERGLDPEVVREIFWRLVELTRRAVEPGPNDRR